MAKITVITGGAGGMGLATAKIVGRENTILVCDINAEKLDAVKIELENIGIQCEVVVCDITDKDSVHQLAEKARSMGTIASVIHTAGVSPSMGSPEKILRINSLGTIYITEAFLPFAQSGFALVHVSSMAAYQLPGILTPKRSYSLVFTNQEKFLHKLLSRVSFLPKKLQSGIAYCISKNFVNWYTRAMAPAFGEKGARILSVSPGSFDTAMGRLEKDLGAGAMADVSALKRFGTPEEIAEVLAFCASEKPGYLTGTDILCDGGTIAGIQVSGKKPDLKM